MQQGRSRVLVDHRERPSGIHEFLGIAGYEIVFDQMKIGDYLINDRLLFERKTLLDLATSVVDGRLFRQARRLANSSHIPVIILEGSAKDLETSRMRRESLQGALVSLSLIFGLPLLRSRCPEETARLMVYAERQIFTPRARPWHLGCRRSHVKKNRQLALLQGLPGVGPVRSRALLQHFGSVQGVACASVDELLEVAGIGTFTANQIRWLLE
jgi:ERCC4-type nuclease